MITQSLDPTTISADQLTEGDHQRYDKKRSPGSQLLGKLESARPPEATTTSRRE